MTARDELEKWVRRYATARMPLDRRTQESDICLDGIRLCLDQFEAATRADERAKTEREIVTHLLEVSKEFDEAADELTVRDPAEPTIETRHQEARTLRNAAGAIERGRY